jgi:hypothetical protein
MGLNNEGNPSLLNRESEDNERGAAQVTKRMCIGVGEWVY